MNNKLLIKILGLLEQKYPEISLAEELAKKLDIKISNNEFSKVLKYLRDSEKIKIVPVIDGLSSKIIYVSPNDEISITNDGIDLLAQKKLLMVNERRNDIMKWATIVIAISTVINLFIILFRILF